LTRPRARRIIDGCRASKISKNVSPTSPARSRTCPTSVRAQGTQLDRLTHHTRMLMQREAEREADAGGPASLDTQRPPHW